MRCQACRRAEATERVCDDPEPTYLLCGACAGRLRARALRPREWFHLASLHGWGAFSLHDDFYDDDGTAWQPESDVDDPASHPFPGPAEWQRDTRLAFEVALVKWSLPHEVLVVLRSDPATTLACLSALARPVHHAAACEVAARALGPGAAAWVRARWAANDAELFSLGHASAACLPRLEALARMSAAIERLAPEERADGLLALSHFDDPAVLGLIERWACSPVLESYGNVAAANRLDWPTVDRWLTSGRPMSLVALDALVALAEPRTPLLRQLRPRLVDPPEGRRFIDTLRLHAARDDAPRVTQAVNYVLANKEALGVLGSDASP